MPGKASVCLDTSVLLRLLVGEPERQAKKAEDALSAVVESGGKAVVSDLVLCETYFALQYHYKIPKENALAALADLSQADEIECSEVARAVFAQPKLHSASPRFADRIIHGQYDAMGWPMLTFEKAARKLPNVRVL